MVWWGGVPPHFRPGGGRATRTEAHDAPRTRDRTPGGRRGGAADRALDRRKRQAEALRRNRLLRKAQARRREDQAGADDAPTDEGC